MATFSYLCENYNTKPNFSMKKALLFIGAIALSFAAQAKDYALSTPNSTLIISASEKGKPKYKGNTHDLCAPAKKQMVEHFFDDEGRRNRRSKAYFGIEKEKQPGKGKKR